MHSNAFGKVFSDLRFKQCFSEGTPVSSTSNNQQLNLDISLDTAAKTTLHKKPMPIFCNWDSLL